MQVTIPRPARHACACEAARAARPLSPPVLLGRQRLRRRLRSAASASSSSTGGSRSTLRFTWWGTDSRHKTTQKVIDAYEAEHPNVTINGEFGEWAGYWDKLATAVAARDAPDIIQMDEKYLRDYAGRGALLDLKTSPTCSRTGEFDENALKSGEFDGGLYGLTTGVNAYSILAEPGDVQGRRRRRCRTTPPGPGTTTRITCRQITRSSPGRRLRTASPTATRRPGLTQWAAQHGESLYTEDGKLGFSPRRP